MKASLLSWGMALLGMSSIAHGVQVQFNKQLINAEAKSVSFESVADPLPHNLFMAADAYGDNNGVHNCSSQNATINSGSVTVLLAISKCLNQSSIDMIEDWVESIKESEMSYTFEGQQMNLEFATTYIPGACEARSERNKHGLENLNNDTWQDGQKLLLSDEGQASDLQQLSAFARFGRVLESVPVAKDDIPIAVISFVNAENAFANIEQYERQYSISNTFNFQICEGGLSCQGRFKNCVFLKENIDLFMYNPFVVVRMFSCDGTLTNGIPVSYVDADGDRQCYCACGAGFKTVVDNYGAHCEKVEPEVCPCTWNMHPLGYRIENTEELETCAFSDFHSRWSVPVPFPSDNYVADNRINDHDHINDDVGLGPHIDLEVTPTYNAVYDYVTFTQWLQTVANQAYSPQAFPTDWESILKSIGWQDAGGIVSVISPLNPRGDTEHQEFTWRDYQVNRDAKIDDLTVNAYGKYELQVEAFDYKDDAKCTGCVAIVDKYRPQATTQCPASFCDNTTSACATYDVATSEMTTVNLDTANQLINSVYDFGEKAKNDACSSDRCDYEVFGMKNFFESTYCSDKQWIEGKKCFDRPSVEQDFLANPISKTNPLYSKTQYDIKVRQEDVPVPQGQCTRCCSYKNSLREYWTDYKCGYDYDLRYCSGLDSQHCEFKQCLVLFGDTMATVSARIKPTIAEESKKVLDNVVQKGFQTYTQVHRSLQCSSFGGTDGVCKFQTKIADLFDTQARSNLNTIEIVKPEDFVFWRYKVKGDERGWHLLNAAEEVPITHVFDKAETKITIEAWTQCGIVRKFYFYVHLHLNSDIKVCDHFSEMWYQSTFSRLPIATDLCAYPNSDFAELTFDYHPNVGLQYDRANLRMNITSVVCQLNFFGRDATEIVHVDATSPEIVERFAIELQNNAETEAITRFHVSCQFTYTRFDKSTMTQTCCKDFSIKDCTPPEIDAPYSECQFDDCAGVDLPGPGEACGGNVVRASNTATYVDSDETECCQSCGNTATVCTAITELPSGDNIKRCEPQMEEGYGYGGYGEYGYTAGVRLLSASEHPVSFAASLLMASALVAVIALVVVKRRRTNAAAKVETDAYYPLLH